MIPADCAKANPSAVPRYGRGAGRGEDGRENALKKRSGVSFARAPAEQPGCRRRREGNLIDAEKIERENEHDRAHHHDEIRVGELERPRDFVPRGLERDHQDREADEPGEDAGGEGEAIAKDAGATVTSVFDEAENLEGDHRQDARHQVKDEAANETKEEQLEQAISRR